ALASAFAGLEVAAVNGPASVAVAGNAEDLAALEARCASEGLRARPLRVSHAFHSAAMDPILDVLEAEVAALALRPAELPLYAGLTGRRDDGSVVEAAWWRRQAREPVLFA